MNAEDPVSNVTLPTGPAVTIDRRGHRFEVTLDRPKANAIDAATSRALGAAFVEFRDDPAFRVAILTGGGERFFSAGWDLMAAADGEAFEADYGPGGFGGFVELPDRYKPVICAVNGMAVGGGFEIAMAAEFVIAADHASFFLPEAGLGIIPDAGALRLARILPGPVANEVLFGGRRLDAAEAERWGLVNHVVKAPDLLEAARALADRIASAAPLAVAAIMEASAKTGHLSLADAYSALRSGEVRNYQAMLTSKDALEGPAAFSEGREPNWIGR